MDSSNVAQASRRWISLGEACHVLEVNSSTLRQWADRGMIRVFRTPGGHRRFSRDDIYSMSQDGSRPSSSNRRINEEVLLRRIRRKLQREGPSRWPWLAKVDEGVRPRIRVFGRLLLSLLLKVASKKHLGRQQREEGYLLGTQYGQEMAQLDIGLEEMLRAFLFFRNCLLESVPDQSRLPMEELADVVLLGIAAGYEGTGIQQEIPLAQGVR